MSTFKKLKSSEIAVFPSSFRHASILSAKKTTEENITTRRISDNLANANYCIELGSNDLELYLAGYRFNFTKVALAKAILGDAAVAGSELSISNKNALSAAPIYAFIKLAALDETLGIGNVLGSIEASAQPTYKPSDATVATIIGNLDVTSNPESANLADYIFYGIGFAQIDDDSFNPSIYQDYIYAKLEFNKDGELISNVLTLDAANIRDSAGIDVNNITQTFTTNTVNSTDANTTNLTVSTQASIANNTVIDVSGIVSNKVNINNTTILDENTVITPNLYITTNGNSSSATTSITGTGITTNKLYIDDIVFDKLDSSLVVDLPNSKQMLVSQQFENKESISTYTSGLKGIFNSGVIYNSSGILKNTGTLENSNTLSNSGTLNNTGTISNSGNVCIGSDSSLTLNASDKSIYVTGKGSSLDISNNATVSISANFTNAGELSNSGSIDNSSDVIIAPNSNVTINKPFASNATLSIAGEGEITNNIKGSLAIQDTINPDAAENDLEYGLVIKTGTDAESSKYNSIVIRGGSGVEIYPVSVSGSTQSVLALSDISTNDAFLQITGNAGAAIGNTSAQIGYQNSGTIENLCLPQKFTGDANIPANGSSVWLVTKNANGTSYLNNWKRIESFEGGSPNLNAVTAADVNVTTLVTAPKIQLGATADNYINASAYTGSARHAKTVAFTFTQAEEDGKAIKLSTDADATEGCDAFIPIATSNDFGLIKSATTNDSVLNSSDALDDKAKYWPVHVTSDGKAYIKGADRFTAAEGSNITIDYNTTTGVLTFGDNETVYSVTCTDNSNDATILEGLNDATKTLNSIVIIKRPINNNAPMPISYKHSAYVYDGSAWQAIQGFYDPESIILSEPLIAYYNIGKITGASQTSPKQVATAGESLQQVFNAVFGVQEDTQPSINNDNVGLTVAAGTTSYSGGEYGTAVAPTTVDITFTLANSGIANYGYRCGTTKITGNQTFYYPVTKQNNADLKITLPSDQDASSTMVIAGTYISHSANVLYCDFNSSKKVTIRIQLPAGIVTTSNQTRYGQISAYVTLGNAQKEDQLTAANTPIAAFLTYLGNDATDTSELSILPKSNTAGPYVINKGSYYNYYITSASETLSNTVDNPITSATCYTGSSVQISCEDAPKYIWFLLPPGTTGNKTIQYEPFANTWVDAFGGADDDTIGPNSVVLRLNSTATVTYQSYRTTAMAAKDSELNYRIIDDVN